MEYYIVWITRALWKLFKVDRKRFMLLLGKESEIDFLPLAYSQRGILKYLGDESGEKFLLHRVLSRGLSNEPLIIDVGANLGDYTAEIHTAFAGAKLYSFEPNPDIANQLKLRVAGYASVIESAVGEKPGRIKLFNNASPGSSAHGSVYSGALTELHRYKDVAYTEVPVTTLDEFSEENGINCIDLLKIDTEGHEFAVLRGSQRLLTEGRIRAIQFEFNEMNVISRVFLKDFFSILTGFDFYRLDSDRLHPIRYSPREEIFQFQNFFAVLAGDKLAIDIREKYAR